MARFFPIEKRCRQSCDVVFSDWLTIIEEWNRVRTSKEAPVEIRSQDRNRFLMKGHAGLQSWYVNEVQEAKDHEPWTVKIVDEEKRKWTSNDYSNMAYGGESAPIMTALNQFKLQGKKGIVVGSQSPWVEAACLLHGARKVITAEYARLTIQHPQIEYAHPEQISKQWKRYTDLDFAFSFSSIEHSGLGRYGDPMDPIGDLREMGKVHCLLKPGGLFFLAVPNGQDMVMFNAHRVYGDVRWPMMAAGWTLVGSFRPDYDSNSNRTDEVRYVRETTGGIGFRQFVYVLKKDDPRSSLAKDC